MQMICSRCGKAGIYWENLTGMAYTYCPNCGGRNCQQQEEQVEEQEEEVEDV